FIGPKGLSGIRRAASLNHRTISASDSLTADEVSERESEADIVRWLRLAALRMPDKPLGPMKKEALKYVEKRLSELTDSSTVGEHLAHLALSEAYDHETPTEANPKNPKEKLPTDEFFMSKAEWDKAFAERRKKAYAAEQADRLKFFLEQ